MSIRITTNIQNNALVVRFIHEPTQKIFEFAGPPDLVEKMAKDLIEAARLAREKLGLPSIILPFARPH